MRASSILGALMAVTLSSACYEISGGVEMRSNTTDGTNTYQASIFATKNGVNVCGGSIKPLTALVPGAIPSISSFNGPWGAFNCSDIYIQVDLFGINGQALIRDDTQAFWLSPETLGWKQWVISGNVAGVPELVSNSWEFDSGSVLC